MGGFQSGCDSIRSIKQYEKQVIAIQSYLEGAKMDMPIIFREVGTKNIAMRHNDLLVIELKVEDCDVTRVLLDTGSLVDLIFKETFKKMDIGTKNQTKRETAYELRQRNHDDHWDNQASCTHRWYH